MWLKTKKGELVNMDRVGLIETVEHAYTKPPMFRVYATIQITRNEDCALIPLLFESPDVFYCEEFVKWVCEQLTTGERVANVADFLAMFESEDV